MMVAVTTQEVVTVLPISGSDEELMFSPGPVSPPLGSGDQPMQTPEAELLAPDSFLSPTATPEPGSPTPGSGDDFTPESEPELTGEWRLAPESSGLPERRHEACATMVNGQVVLIGGRRVNQPTSIYNPKSKEWRNTTGPGKGERLHHFQCVEAGGSIWAINSWRGFFPFESANEHVYEYNVTADSWSKHPGMPAHRNRGGSAAVRKGDLIFAVAGNRGGHGAHAMSVPWVDAFNWRNKEWVSTTYPDMPDEGRDHVGGAMVKGQMCIAGGRNGGTKRFFRANIATTYCYDFELGEWEQKEDMPYPRAGASTGETCDGRMMVAGGEGNGQAYARVDLFDGEKWEQAPSLVDSRHSSGVAFSKCENCAHVFIPSGGGSQGGRQELTSTEEYIPNGSPQECESY